MYQNINDYEDIISLGNNCDIGLSLKQLKLKKETYPFDWVRSNPKIIYDLLINGPEKYITFDNPDSNNYDIKDNFEIKDMFSYFNNKKIIPNSHINFYGQHFTHYLNFSMDDLKKTFNKYIERFFNKLYIGQNIIFIHTTENYILHKLSRDNKNVYYDYLIKISEYFKINYPKLLFKIINIEVDNYRENTEYILNYNINYNFPYSDNCEIHTDKFLVPFRNEVTRILKNILM